MIMKGQKFFFFSLKILTILVCILVSLRSYHFCQAIKSINSSKFSNGADWKFRSTRTSASVTPSILSNFLLWVFHLQGSFIYLFIYLFMYLFIYLFILVFSFALLCLFLFGEFSKLVTYIETSGANTECPETNG